MTACPNVREPSEERVEGVLSGFGELDAHDDVRPALELLRDAGVPAVALSNGAAEGRWNTAMVTPDVTGHSLVEVVRGLLG